MGTGLRKQHKVRGHQLSTYFRECESTMGMIGQRWSERCIEVEFQVELLNAMVGNWVLCNSIMKSSEAR